MEYGDTKVNVTQKDINKLYGKAFSWLKVDYWYHVFILLGAAGTIAALIFDLKGISNSHALLFFLGIFFIGIGEWINHPLLTGLMHPNVYARGGAIITGHPRKNSFLGLFFDMLGMALVGTALYKISIGA